MGSTIYLNEYTVETVASTLLYDDCFTMLLQNECNNYHLENLELTWVTKRVVFSILLIVSEVVHVIQPYGTMC